MGRYLLALDQGTTSCRTILYDERANPVSISQKEFTQIYPAPSWVEHDPMEIWETQLFTLRTAFEKAHISADEIAAVGITNQRETTVVWDRETGRPVYNAIVWQCRRTADICRSLEEKGLSAYIQEHTGLIPDAYFSATKIKWILDNVPGARELAQKGRLLFGTIDTWLIYQLSGGKTHITDYTNASRTMLYDIKSLCWDKKLLDELEIPESMMPEVVPSSGELALMCGEILGTPIPICGVAGDQQAALFGQGCFSVGEAKNTYGTGCCLLMTTGEELVHSKNGLVSTIACGLGGRVEYALEGSVFVGGAVIQWLRDELGLIENAAQSCGYAQSVPDTNGVYLVPAFAGLGAPHWDMYARGIVCGLSRGASKAHIIRAALESIAYQTLELLEAIQADSGITLRELMVDGGACGNDFLMQFQADILGQNVNRPVNTESTALGAAFLAGLGAGVFQSRQQLKDIRRTDRIFSPQICADKRAALVKGWKDAVEMCMFHGEKR